MIAVIGDIHGCYFTLLELYSRIKRKFPEAEIISIGDLVDRGNNSYEVMNFIINEGITFVPGNHDYMIYHFFKYPSSIFARSWVFNGNEATLESYLGHEKEIFEHIEIIANAPLYLNLEDAFVSHAGVSKYYENFLPEDYQNDLTLLDPFINKDYLHDIGVLWTRDPLLNLGKLQIVGHSKLKKVKFDVDANAVYIDTGAFAGDKLSAVIVEDSEIVEVLSEPTHINDYRLI
jgi:serine/threonine protein phosphatase 1